MAKIDHRNNAEYWVSRRLDGVSLMHADFTTHDFPPHRHNAMVIALTERGGSVVETRTGSEIFTNAELLVLDPTEMHATRMGSSGRWRYRAFYFEESALQEIACRLGLETFPHVAGPLIADREVVAAFEVLHRTMHRNHDFLLEAELLVEAFSLLVHRHSDVDRSPIQSPLDVSRLRQLTDFIQDNLAEPLSLTLLSQRLCLSEHQLIGLFKRVTGMTPHAFVTQLRVDRAAHHLKTGANLAEVSHLVGFYDQSALTKYFKRCHGITPLKFAIAQRADASSINSQSVARSRPRH